MTQKYSGITAVPLSLGVWLATDKYDYNNDAKTISATTLLKPLRQIILPSRIPAELAMPDLMSMWKNRIGTAIHDSIESAWVNNYAGAMQAMGIPNSVIAKIKINPKPEDLQEGDVAVYFEQRLSRVINGWTVTGKFDFLYKGKLEDFKSTSTYVYEKQVNGKKFAQQGSIYRWLDPKLITGDHIGINHIFTDWKGGESVRNPKYPPTPLLRQEFPLASVHETEMFIVKRLADIEKYWNAEEHLIPQCTDEELWRSDPVFKYYKNPEKTLRSTKNFDTLQEANLRLVEDGSVGIVKEVPGQATACKFCPAFAACTQKDDLIKAGDLII